MPLTELSALLDSENVQNYRKTNGLSVLFAVICIVDVFGVFPIITLPKAVIDCGYLGILLIFLVCGLQMYTAILLGKSWIMAEKLYPIINRKDRFPYSALTEVAFGTALSKCVEILLDVTIFGAGIPNLILASQNIQLLVLRLSENTFDVSYCYWIIIMGTLLCPILWIGSPKDMKLLCSISVVTVTSVFLLVSASLLFNVSPETEKENDSFLPDRSLWETILSTYGIIAFQFDIHPSILTIQVDMKEQNKLPKAVLGGFAVSVLMGGITTIIAAAKYGDSIQPSVLETLPASLSLHVAAGLVALQLCLTSAVSNSALYQHMEDCFGISRHFNHKRCILRTILTLLAIVLAESVPRFDLVMSLIGGTLTGPLVFILPPMLYIKMLSLHKNNHEKLQIESFRNVLYTEEEPGRLQVKTIYKKRSDLIDTIQLIFCIIIIISSICMTVTTTYFNFINAISYANFTKPCVYNISRALLYF